MHVYLYFVAMKEYFIFNLWQIITILSLLCGNDRIFYLCLVAMKKIIFTLWRWMNMLSLLCGNEGIFYLYFVAMKEYFIFTLWQWRNILSLLCGNEGLFFFTLWQWRNILSLLCGNEGIFYLYLVAMKEYFIFTLWRCKNSSFSIASCSRSLSKTYLYAIIKLIHPHFCQYVKYHHICLWY